MERALNNQLFIFILLSGIFDSSKLINEAELSLLGEIQSDRANILKTELISPLWFSWGTEGSEGEGCGGSGRRRRGIKRKWIGKLHRCWQWHWEAWRSRIIWAEGSRRALDGRARKEEGSGSSALSSSKKALEVFFSCKT